MLNGSTFACEKMKQDISSMFDLNEDCDGLLADFDKSDHFDLFPHFADRGRIVCSSRMSYIRTIRIRPIN